MHPCSSAFRSCTGWSVTFGLFALLAVVPSGCVRRGQGRAYPLYPNPDQPRQPETLVRLEGPIATVDGQEVASNGTAFDLLPGCHVVILRRKLGESNGNGAWSADLPRIVYAFQTIGGHSYEIEVVARFGNSTTKGVADDGHIRVNAEIMGPTGGATHGQVTITAKERDSAGTVLKVLPPARGQKNIEACVGEAASPR